MAAIDVTNYSHSPTHKAVVSKDYGGLRKIIAGLPRLCDPSEIHNESISLVEEAKVDAISAVIDRRDAVNCDTPLHLAVKLGDVTATEMLMLAGADWSLQNEQGWSALQINTSLCFLCVFVLTPTMAETGGPLPATNNAISVAQLPMANAEVTGLPATALAIHAAISVSTTSPFRCHCFHCNPGYFGLIPFVICNK